MKNYLSRHSLLGNAPFTNEKTKQTNNAKVHNVLACVSFVKICKYNKWKTIWIRGFLQNPMKSLKDFMLNKRTH